MLTLQLEGDSVPYLFFDSPSLQQSNGGRVRRLDFNERHVIATTGNGCLEIPLASPTAKGL